MSPHLGTCSSRNRVRTPSIVFDMDLNLAQEESQRVLGMKWNPCTAQ